MAEGPGEACTAVDLYEQHVAAEGVLCKSLGIIPECIRSIVPHDVRLTAVGDHVRVRDDEGHNWMRVASYQEFRSACQLIHKGRELPRGMVLWVIIMPQIPLQDARDVQSLIESAEKFKETPQPKAGIHGWCYGVPFMVKNLPLLQSKLAEHKSINWFSDESHGFSELLSDRVENLKKHSFHNTIWQSKDTVLQDHRMTSEECKIHVILSMYVRGLSDHRDIHDRFGPHDAILSLLPDLHRSIYVGPEKYDPCNSRRNNSDDHMVATEYALNDEMHRLMLENPSFEKNTSVDQQCCSLLNAEGNLKKMAEILSAFDDISRSVDVLQNDLRRITLRMKKLCIEPTLIGNIGAGPEWMSQEDYEWMHEEDEDKDGE